MPKGSASGGGRGTQHGNGGGCGGRHGGGDGGGGGRHGGGGGGGGGAHNAVVEGNRHKSTTVAVMVKVSESDSSKTKSIHSRDGHDGGKTVAKDARK